MRLQRRWAKCRWEIMNCRYLIALAFASALASGCAWVSLTPEGASVQLVANSEVMDCERLGTTKARVLRELGFIPRRMSVVRRELEILARNESAKLGGNTVTPLPSQLEGERPFAVYRCDD